MNTQRQENQQRAMAVCCVNAGPRQGFLDRLHANDRVEELCASVPSRQKDPYRDATPHCRRAGRDALAARVAKLEAEKAQLNALLRTLKHEVVGLATDNHVQHEEIERSRARIR
jgi:hypothetical protein